MILGKFFFKELCWRPQALFDLTLQYCSRCWGSPLTVRCPAFFLTLDSASVTADVDRDFSQCAGCCWLSCWSRAKAVDGWMPYEQLEFPSRNHLQEWKEDFILRHHCDGKEINHTLPSIIIFVDSTIPGMGGSWLWWLLRMFRSNVFRCGPSGGNCWMLIGGAWCVGVTGMPSVISFWFCGDERQLLLLREASSNRF